MKQWSSISLFIVMKWTKKCTLCFKKEEEIGISLIFQLLFHCRFFLFMVSFLSFSICVYIIFFFSLFALAVENILCVLCYNNTFHIHTWISNISGLCVLVCGYFFRQILSMSSFYSWLSVCLTLQTFFCSFDSTFADFVLYVFFLSFGWFAFNAFRFRLIDKLSNEMMRILVVLYHSSNITSHKNSTIIVYEMEINCVLVHIAYTHTHSLRLCECLYAWVAESRGSR